MKTKKIVNSLVLNKKTVADLNNRELKHIYGGASVDTCFTDCRTRCATDCCDTIKRTCEC